MKMLSVTYDFLRISLKLCLFYSTGNQSIEVQWESMELGDVLLIDIFTALSSSTRPSEKMSYSKLLTLRYLFWVTSIFCLIKVWRTKATVLPRNW